MDNTALLTAVGILAAGATPDTLRRILHQLVDDQAPTPDMATPAIAAGGHDVAGAASLALASTAGSKAAPPVAPRTIRKASPAKPTRPSSSTANGSPSRLSAAEWLKFRERVTEKMQAEGLDMAGLATAMGYATPTVRGIMLKRTPPSAPIAAKLRAFLAGPTGGNAAPAKGNGAASPRPAPAIPAAPANGHAASAAPDDAKMLAAKLRAKRRPLPLTSTTLAGQIGVQPDELDDALHGRPVPPQAAERLSAWATA